MKPKLKLALLASTVMLNASFVCAAEVDIEKAEQTVAAVATKLKAADPRLLKEDFIFDEKLYVMFEKETGSGMVPVKVSGQQYFTDSLAQVLIQPTGLIVTKASGGVIRGNEVIVDYLFDEHKGSSWASSKVVDGVTKKADLYVFTDPTCGYCQKVEQELDTYLMNGIEVHKIPFPRAGLNIQSAGYQKWLAASCSEDPAKAYGEMILGTDGGKYPVPTDLTQECVKIVEDGYNFGLEVGVKGTPFIYGKTVNGESVMFNGYNPVANIAGAMGVVIKSGL